MNDVSEIQHAARLESERIIAMQGIEHMAGYIKNDADQLIRYCGMLVSLPSYETNAEAAVVEAIAALQEGLKKTADAYAAIRGKRK